MKATNILWDVDFLEDLAYLPVQVEIPNEVAFDEYGEIDYDRIDDYISDMTGFCHKGYVLET